MKYNRLTHFINNKEKLSRYRLAVGILYELGVDQLLADMGAPVDVDTDHPNITIINALQNQKAIGYKNCIDNLFNLDSTEIPEEEKKQPDYGAIDAMVKEGRIDPKDADSFMKDM